MTDRASTRRALLGAAVPLFATFLLPRRGVAAVARIARRETLRVGVVLPAVVPADGVTRVAAQGIALGAEESTRTAALFGVDVDVVERRIGPNDDPARVAEELISHDVAAIVAAIDRDRCPAIDAAVQARALFVTLDCRPEAAASETSCRALAAHLSPSAATLRRARVAYARRSGATDDSQTRVALWHHTLRRFGAEQLNERFRRRFGRDMTAPAWAGWAAMKIITEAALRSRSTRGREIAQYVTSTAVRFDGHKGEPLVVDPRSGELRQPLYVVTRDADDRERVAAELSVAECYEPIGRRACVAPPQAR